MRFFKRKLCFMIFIICLFFFLFFSALSYASTVSTDLASSVFRLHIIANSDSGEDQALKLKVRDALINYMNLYDFDSKDSAISFARAHLDDLKNIADNTIIESGYDYPVKVEIGSYDFPTKRYGDVSLPAGCYDALRVKIGESNGHNWWCVMFPPLCFVDVSSGVIPEDSKETLEQSLSEEDYSLISSSNNEFNFKFKIVELIKNLL